MKKALALVVAVAMGLSSAVFAAEITITPAPTVATTKAMSMETTHHRKQYKTAPAQKVQAAKKHHKNMKAEQRAPERKAQTAKKHAKKHSHQQPAKPAAQPTA